MAIPVFAAEPVITTRLQTQLRSRTWWGFPRLLLLLTAQVTSKFQALPVGNPGRSVRKFREPRICFRGSLVQLIQARAIAIFPTSGISFSQIFDRHFRLPMVLSWNLTAEHGFEQDWMLRVAYVGNSGHHLSGTGDQESGLLQLNPSHWDPVTQQEVPVYPDYGSIASINSGVDSNYNAAQITLDKAHDARLFFSDQLYMGQGTG